MYSDLDEFVSIVVVFAFLLIFLFVVIAIVSLVGFVLGILAFAETREALHLVITILFPIAGIYFYCKHCKKKKPSRECD